QSPHTIASYPGSGGPHLLRPRLVMSDGQAPADSAKRVSQCRLTLGLTTGRQKRTKDADVPVSSLVTANCRRAVAELDFQVRETRGCRIGTPAGEIDIDNAPIPGDRLGALVEEGHTVLDLSLVTFLDSTALSAIIRAYRTGQSAGHHLRLAGARG